MKRLATIAFCALFLTGCVEYTYLELNGEIWPTNPMVAEGGDIRAAGFDLDVDTGVLLWIEGGELLSATTIGHVDCRMNGATGRFHGVALGGSLPVEGSFSIQTRHHCRAASWSALE